MEVSEVGDDRKSHGLLLTDDRLCARVPRVKTRRPISAPKTLIILIMFDFSQLTFSNIDYETHIIYGEIFHIIIEKIYFFLLFIIIQLQMTLEHCSVKNEKNFWGR